MLDIAALLNDLEEPPQLRFGKQLRQLALLLCPAQAQLPAGLLGNVEEIVVVEPRFAGDADELRHHFGFRFFLWRYEVRPFAWTLAAHGRASNGILLRLLVFLRNTIVAPAQREDAALKSDWTADELILSLIAQEVPLVWLDRPMADEVPAVVVEYAG